MYLHYSLFDEGLTYSADYAAKMSSPELALRLRHYLVFLVLALQDHTEDLTARNQKVLEALPKNATSLSCKL